MMRPSRWGRVLLLIFVIALAVIFFMKRSRMNRIGACSLLGRSAETAVMISTGRTE